MLAAGRESEVYKRYSVPAAGLRKNNVCPNCYSNDRERSLYLFLTTKKLISPDSIIVHIAPEKNLGAILQNTIINNYVSAEIAFGEGMVQMDITMLPLKDKCCNLILCNHVLEHVPNDRRAMRELCRILKSKGKAIIQVPFAPTLQKTKEDLSINNSRLQEKRFGQEDHVRLYGRDYITRLVNAGFIVESNAVHQLWEKNVIKKYALAKQEIIFYCTKKEQ